MLRSLPDAEGCHRRVRTQTKTDLRKPAMPDVHPAEGQVFPVKPEVAAKAHITAPRYQEMFERAARDPDGFWSEQSRRIAWMKAPTRIKNSSFAGDVVLAFWLTW